MTFNKDTYDYLLNIVLDDKSDATQVLIEDLAKQTDSPDVHLKLCQRMVERIETSSLGFKTLDRTITFICEYAKQIKDSGHQRTYEKVLDMLMTDKIINRRYSMICDGLLEILKEKERAESVLRRVLEIYKDAVQVSKKRTVVESQGMDILFKESFQDCSSSDFCKLASYWFYNIGSKEFPDEVVSFAIPFVDADDYYQHSQMAEYFCVTKNPEKAMPWFKRAETLAIGFDEKWDLCFNLFFSLKNEQLAKEAIHKIVSNGDAKTAEDYCKVAEVYGCFEGKGSRKECLEIYRLARKACVNDSEVQSVLDSVENTMDFWKAKDGEERNESSTN